MNKHLISILKAVGFFSIGFGILYLLYLSQNKSYMAECALKGIAEADCNLLDKIWSDFKSADLSYIFVALVIFMISNIARAMRWLLLLEPLDYQPSKFNSFATIMVGYLANLGFPRSGEFVRAGLLSKYEDFAPEKVMGTIITDRLADVICLLIVIALGVILSFPQFSAYFSENPYLVQKIDQLTSLKSMVFILIGVAVASFFLYKYRSALLANKWATKIKKMVLGLWEGVISIMKLKSPGLFIFYSLVIWLSYYLMTYIIFFSFEPTAHLSPIAGLVVFIFGTFGIIIPSPGGMGSYHFLTSEALGMYGISGVDAFSLANILFFSISIFCNVLFGLFSLILLPIVNKK